MNRVRRKPRKNVPHTSPENGLSSNYRTSEQTSITISSPSAPSQLKEADSQTQSSQDNGNARGLGAPESATRPHIWWVSPFTMIGVLVLGVGFALGHHVYYAHLDGTVVPNSAQQQWAIRYGTGFAFLTKCSLAAAVAIAHSQRAWVTMRNKSLSINGIDSLSSAPHDITSLRTWEMLSKAKLASLLALICWTIPLSTVVTPAALTTRPMERVEDARNMTVPSLYFYDYEKFASVGTAISDTATTLQSYAVFAGPTILTNRLCVASSSSGTIIPMTGPFPFTKYSYTIQLPGPAIKCEAANASTGNTLQEIKAPMEDLCDPHSTGETGAYYFAMAPGYANGSVYAVDLSAYTFSQFEKDHQENSDGASERWPIAPEIWITTSQGEGTNRSQNATSGNANADTCSRIRANWRNTTCSLYNATYSVQFTFDNGVQTATVEDIVYNQRLSFSARVPMNADSSIGDLSLFSFQAIWISITRQLVGLLDQESYSSGILQTYLVGSSDLADFVSASAMAGATSGANPTGPPPWLGSFNKPLSDMIEELSQNVTLSLLSSSAMRSQNGTEALVKFIKTVSLYTYNKRNLLLSYLIAITAATFSVSIGIASLFSNGASYNFAFSTVLRTTRNPDLDRLAQNHESGVQPLHDSLGRIRLVFGNLAGTGTFNGAPAQGKMAFGQEGMVNRIS